MRGIMVMLNIPKPRDFKIPHSLEGFQIPSAKFQFLSLNPTKHGNVKELDSNS